jgi:dienelactone hydrolase
MPTPRPLRRALVRRALVLTVGCIVSHAAGVRAQNSHAGVALSDVAGVWDYRATVGQPNGAVVGSVLTATATRAGWTIQHDPDPAIPLRVVAVGGDSIVAEAGPYGSTLRPGQTVLLNHIVLHSHDTVLTGTFLARYSSGDSVGGRADATRRATPTHPSDGAIVSIEPYHYPVGNALTPQQLADRNHYYPTAAAYEKAAAALDSSKNEMQTVTYLSDGLKVKAYVYKPRDTGTQRYPVIVLTRGDMQRGDIGFLYAPYFERMSPYGFVIVAPQYRQSAGGEGHDEMGGADVDDVMNLQFVIRQLPYADPRNVFMYGDLRGGMMTFQAIRYHFPMNAAATTGAFSDFEALLATDSTVRNARDTLFPDYAQHRTEIITKRSAILWAGELRTPLLLMHGGADTQIPAQQTLELAEALERLHIPYSVVIYAGDNAGASKNRLDRDARAMAWFRAHMVQ